VSTAYDNWITAFYNENFNAAAGSIGGLTQLVTNASQSHNAGDDHAAQSYIIQALQKIDAGRLDLLDVYTYSFPRYNIVKLFCLADDRLDALEAVGPAEVTMASIISAMFSASNAELKDFIGLNDAYRQSLWNKPFDRAYWAAIARGFEIWG